MSVPLYQLRSEYMALLEFSDGEEQGDYTDAINKSEGDLSDKIVAVAKVIKMLESEERAFSEEASRLSKLATYRRNRADSLKKYLLQNMEAADIQAVQGDVIKVRLQNNPPSVAVVDESKLQNSWRRATLRMPIELVPETLLGYITTKDIDKQGIHEFIKKGNEAPDGVVLTQGKHVRIA